jgi:NAD(P)-dependent dehydrogenase (short-subunit alcohol dehydrogenase family)
MNSPLSNKTFVITGATSGIGLAAAENLMRQGANVIGVGRSTERSQQAEMRLNSLYPQGTARYYTADLALQSQIRMLAQAIESGVRANGCSHLDGLINNAGRFTFWRTLTAEGFEMQWAVNHLAPFLLTHALLPLLQAAPMARVVTVSSMSHYRGRIHWKDIQHRRFYNCLGVYQQTKLANVLFTAELNHRFGNQRLRAFAADPGLVITDIGVKDNPVLVRWVWQWRRAGGITPEESAKGVVFLATEPSIQQSSEIYWKHSSPKPPNPYALEPEAARRLWALSEQMCGLES